MVTVSCCCGGASYIWLSAFGLIFIILGSTLLGLENSLIQSVLHAELTCIEGTPQYDNWKQADAPVYLSVYIWNVTNSHEFEFIAKPKGPGNKHATWSWPVPIVEQIGPFVYQEQYAKSEIDYLDSEGNEHVDVNAVPKKDLLSIRSYQKTSYKPVYGIPGLGIDTGLDPQTVQVSTANILGVSIPKVIDWICLDLANSGSRLSCDGIIGNQLINVVNDIMDNSGEPDANGKISPVRPVLDVMPAETALWEYEDPVLRALKYECENNLFFDVPFFDLPISCKDSEIGDVIINKLPEFFGILVMKNSPLGWSSFQQKTGVEDFSQYLKMEKWTQGEDKEKLEERVSFWNDEPANCNAIVGTDGFSTFPNPSPEIGETISFFSPDIFRSIEVNFTSIKSSPNYDLPVYEYFIQPWVFASPSKFPENACYCIDSMWNNPNAPTGILCEEYLDGAIVASDANFGIPLTISNPHFLWADKIKSLSKYVEGGMSPSEEEHATFLQYEPKTGAPIVAQKKIQQSLAIVKDTRFNIYENLKSADTAPDSVLDNDDVEIQVMPLVWVNESFLITEDLEFDVYLGTDLAPKILIGVGAGLLGIGVALVALAAWYFLNRQGKGGGVFPENAQNGSSGSAKSEKVDSNKPVTSPYAKNNESFEASDK